MWRFGVPPAGHRITPRSNVIDILMNSRLIDDDNYAGVGEILGSRNVAHCTIGAVCNPMNRTYGISSTVQDIEMSCSAASVNACRSVVLSELPRRLRRLRITRKPRGRHRCHRADFR